jgi:tetratricopeptide (TPR) repeat protein
MNMGFTENIYLAKCKVIHHGYDDPELTKKKAERNIEILRMEPQNRLTSLYIAESLQICEKFQEAITELQPHIDKIDWTKQDEIDAEILYTYGSLQYRTEDIEGALLSFQRSTKPDAIFMAAEVIAHNSENGSDRAAIEYYQRYINEKPTKPPLFPYKYADNSKKASEMIEKLKMC